MPLIASRNTTPPVPVGQYAARCIDVFDAGWWENMEGAETNKCKVVFYLGKDEETGRDLYIDLFETLSLSKKANLTKHLENWRGTPFTPEELKGFDIEKLLNKGALIQVASKPKQDGTPRTIIGAIMQLPKGMKAPDAPADYKRDQDRDEPMATKFPRKKQPAAAKSDADAGADVKKDEDDDLPF